MQAKKSLGQNFLKDSKTLDIIVDNVSDELLVLEIGPGKGAMTKRLLEAGCDVIAIEKDHRLIEPLSEMFENELKSGQFQLIEGDALEETPEKLGLKTGQFQVVANLPYYITGLYLRHTLESDIRPMQMTLLLQKEVVDRIMAKDGKESVLSISVKCFGQVRKLCNVNKKCFSPAPRVDSAVLQISNISQQLFVDAQISPNDFFKIVKSGFASKRKTLANNLKAVLSEAMIDFELTAQQLGLNQKIRAEKLSINQWINLTKILTENI